MASFVDQVTIEVVSGSGGRGAVSFRREKYVPQGGPDGGDGGRGGDVILLADPEHTTLGDYRERRRYAARNGVDGSRQLCSGADGEDLVLRVAPGTVISDQASGELVADLDHAGARAVVCRGGRGGRGNARFATSTRQAPRVGELGERGRQRSLKLELKLIADIGLVGLPNAGKSTLLAAVTGARPKIAAYPFTTLAPNLGVAETEYGHPFVIADVPGLIEGAHAGVGLGHDFLRHLERTRVLVHVVDGTVGESAARDAVAQIEDELRRFSATLFAKPRLLAINKIDDTDARATAAQFDAYAISAATGEGCEALLDAAVVAVRGAREAELAAAPGTPSGEHRVYRHEARGADAPAVSRDGEAYRITSERIERWVEQTDLGEEDALSRLQKRMRAAGVDAALAAAGCGEGDTVRIGAAEFEWHE